MIFFFNDTATTEIYTLSLHNALPISTRSCRSWASTTAGSRICGPGESSNPRSRGEPTLVILSAAKDLVEPHTFQDRKSTRLNSSHANISYAVFCLKKNKQINTPHPSY